MIHKNLEILHNPSLKQKFSPGACTVTDSISLLPRALPCYPTQYNLLSGGFRFFWWRSWCRRERKKTHPNEFKKKTRLFFSAKSPTKMPGCSFYTMNKRLALFPWSANSLLWFRNLKKVPQKKIDSRLGGDGNFPIIRGCGSCNLLNSVEFWLLNNRDFKFMVYQSKILQIWSHACAITSNYKM